jgi:exodeoxyribonuclease VIII
VTDRNQEIIRSRTNDFYQAPPDRDDDDEVNAPTEELGDGPKLGLFPDVTNEDYHRGPGISKSGLDGINRSPAHYWYRRHHPEPPTRNMEIGTAFHALVLEPESFADVAVVGLAHGKRKKEEKEAWARFAAEHEGKIILTTAEWDTIHRMCDAVVAHPFASILLDPDSGPVESSAYWIDDETRKLCKVRPDKLNDAHGLCVDLKSAADASYTGFAEACARYRYPVQAAFYTDGLFRAGHMIKDFYFIAVEKEPPYGIGIYRLDKPEMEFGRLEYQRNLAIYAECHNSGEWPCYPPEPRTLQIPRWGLRARAS